MGDTRKLAETIAGTLEEKLAKAALPSIACVYIPGSFCRGDWLNNSSDLDIHIIFSEEPATKENDLQIIYDIVNAVPGKNKFYSHAPGGIDYGYSEMENIPKTPEEALKPCPYLYFSAFMFDLKQHCKTIYGTELKRLLPETPYPKTAARGALGALLERTKKLRGDDIKIIFNSYKIVLLLQMVFGQNTINKYTMLELYQKNVPPFKTKWFGETVIRNYIGSIYPERPPVLFDAQLYSDFFDDAESLLKQANLAGT